MTLLRLVPRFVCAAALATLAACSAEAPSSTPAPAAATPPAAAPAPDLKAVARSMVAAGLVKAGDKVIITGSVRDHALLENLAIETMKVGGQPLITVGSQELGRRSYDEVPDTFDSQADTLGLAMAGLQDVTLTVDIGDSETMMAGVPAARVAARAQAGMPVSQVLLKRGVRTVNLGNGLYPTQALATRLGRPQAEVAAIFWKAAMVAPETIRAKGDALQAALRSGQSVTLTSASGTKLTFGVVADRGFVSDGAITAEKVKQGNAATQTWLPAGELLVPAALGTAEGQVVIDKMVFQGGTVEGLTLTFSKGKLTSMTAKSGLDALKAVYDASAGGKDQFAFIDIGLNPEANLPTDTGRIVWMAPGAITIGLGDNTFWGGTNTSTFSLSASVGRATLTAGSQVLIENGLLK